MYRSSSENFYYNNNHNRSYRHSVTTEYNYNEKFQNNQSMSINSLTENDINRIKTERSSRIQMESSVNYEKLLNNLKNLSGVMNNFFNILQGILHMKIDTLFTDFSSANIIGIDIRCQKILMTLMEKMNLYTDIKLKFL